MIQGLQNVLGTLGQWYDAGTVVLYDIGPMV